MCSQTCGDATTCSVGSSWCLYLMLSPEMPKTGEGCLETIHKIGKHIASTQCICPGQSAVELGFVAALVAVRGLRDPSPEAAVKTKGAFHRGASGNSLSGTVRLFQTFCTQPADYRRGTGCPIGAVLPPHTEMPPSSRPLLACPPSHSCSFLSQALGFISTHLFYLLSPSPSEMLPGCSD